MSENKDKKVIFSGIQPSGNLTLGNYLGALKNWVTLQKEYNCYYCVVDMHAITVRQEPAELRKRCLDLMSIMLAAGVDPKQNTLYVQSHVSAHAELAWVLNCFTYMGELNRMTQFKEKAARHADNLNAGLYTYPVLMAADILLYRADLVPVGEDQRQHLEITRDIAARFNNIYGDVFVIPDAYIPKAGARIMSLQEPEKKMSKSDPNENAFIAILDDPDTIRRKLKRAVTDSQTEIRLSEDKPGVSNLLSIYAAVTGQTLERALWPIEGTPRGVVQLVHGMAEHISRYDADAVVAELEPLQKRYKEIRADKAYLNEVISEGSEKAARTAFKTLAKVQRKVGFGAKKL